MNRQLLKRTFFFLTLIGLASAAFAKPAHARPTRPTTRHAHVARVQESAHARRHMAGLRHARPVAAERRVVMVRTRSGMVRRTVLVRHRYYEHFSASSFTDSDITQGDVTAGEDPVVRQAAIDALGNMYGTVVAIDPGNGRILAMVNQKLALSSGAEPCSTIKVSVALAALQEGIVTKDTPVNLGGSYRVNMTEALAKSNNLYFETLGRRLGFERVRHYANSFGLGELAGWNIPGEQLGIYPEQVLPESEGGVGRMCSFGQGISMTPLQLGALVASIANGGTLYYLQHPTYSRRGSGLPAAGEADAGYRQTDPGSHGRHGGRGRLRHGQIAAHQLQPAPHSWQDRYLLQQRHPLRLVRLICQHLARSHRHRLLPRGRPSDLWPQGRGTDWRFLPQSLGPQLLRGKASTDTATSPRRGSTVSQ